MYLVTALVINIVTARCVGGHYLITVLVISIITARCVEGHYLVTANVINIITVRCVGASHVSRHGPRYQHLSSQDVSRSSCLDPNLNTIIVPVRFRRKVLFDYQTRMCKFTDIIYLFTYLRP